MVLKGIKLVHLSLEFEQSVFNSLSCKFSHCEPLDRSFRFRLMKSMHQFGVSSSGIAETFSTAPPFSLRQHQAQLRESPALEYGESCDFPVWIDRCGVIAGAGQFGRADQGIFSFWINAYLRRQPLKYVSYRPHRTSSQRLHTSDRTCQI